jgi:hypothetical protein
MSSNWKLAALLATATATTLGTASSAHATVSWDHIQGQISGTWGKTLFASDVPGYYTIVNAFNDMFPFNANGYVDFTANIGLDSSTAYARAYATVGGSVDMGPVHSGMQAVQYEVEPEVHMNNGSFNAAYGVYGWNSISNQYTVIDFNILFEAHLEKSIFKSIDLFPAQTFDIGTQAPIVGNIVAHGHVNASASLAAGVHTDLIHGVQAHIDASPSFSAGLTFDTDQVSVLATFSPLGVYTRARGDVIVGEIKNVNNAYYACASIHGKADLDRAGIGGMTVLTPWTVNWPFHYEGYSRTDYVDFERCLPAHL